MTVIIHEDMELEEYHNSGGISSSGIKLILDCPRRYFWEYHIARPTRTNEQVKASKDKFVLGRALHTLVLEEHKFNDLFYNLVQKLDLRKKGDKEIYEKAVEEANGRQIIRAEDWDTITEMAAAIIDHPRFDEMKGGKVEQSIFWKHKGEFYTADAKARPDIYTDNIILDIKTTDSIQKFKYNFHNLGYHRQAAMQFDALYALDGIKRHFGFLVVEKKEPYLTAAFTLGYEELMHGRKEYTEGTDLYAECLKHNHWPAYNEQYEALKIPKWKMREEEYDD